jgi:hypothetical protein
LLPSFPAVPNADLPVKDRLQQREPEYAADVHQDQSDSQRPDNNERQSRKKYVRVQVPKRRRSAKLRRASEMVLMPCVPVRGNIDIAAATRAHLAGKKSQDADAHPKSPAKRLKQVGLH